jgi:hypothetical protein
MTTRLAPQLCNSSPIEASLQEAFLEVISRDWRQAQRVAGRAIGARQWNQYMVTRRHSSGLAHGFRQRGDDEPRWTRRQITHGWCG